MWENLGGAWRLSRTASSAANDAAFPRFDCDPCIIRLGRSQRLSSPEGTAGARSRFVQLAVIPGWRTSKSLVFPSPPPATLPPPSYLTFTTITGEPRGWVFASANTENNAAAWGVGVGKGLRPGAGRRGNSKDARQALRITIILLLFTHGESSLRNGKAK